MTLWGAIVIVTYTPHLTLSLSTGTRERERAMLSNKERGTIVFALEEYAKVLEIENSYEAKNSVLELIWKLDTREGEGE
jgi:hypothetical protein